jgi:signal transduction histidine kinase
VLADPVRLSQLFDNVIGNSYKYAGTDIEIESGFDDDFLTIRMRDFGRGVSKSDLPGLFHKFYRGDNAKEKKGYGLGLYISKYLINKMGGDIICENLEDGFLVIILLKLAG